jgi:opacity protein-like surface antigen
LNPNIDLFFSSKDTVGKIEFLGTTYETQFTTNLAGYDLNLDVNILKGPLTPVITGGIGYINFSGGEEVSFSETDFSYNIGRGLRWDIAKDSFIKALYRAIWTQLEGSDKSLRFDSIGIIVGYMF